MREGALTSTWVSYVEVESVETATDRARQLGARILREKTQGPAGEFAVISDPADAKLALWQSAQA